MTPFFSFEFSDRLILPEFQVFRHTPRDLLFEIAENPPNAKCYEASLRVIGLRGKKEDVKKLKKIALRTGQDKKKTEQAIQRLESKPKQR